MYNEDFKLFNSKDFLSLAKELDKDNQLACTENSIKRTIVSRMYYSVFLHAREWLIDKEKIKEDVVNHNEVILYFRDEQPLESFELNKEITDRLITLKKNRVHCDYIFDVPTEDDDPDQIWSVFTLEDLFEKADYIFKKLIY